jgi:hypothetical protein
MLARDRRGKRAEEYRDMRLTEEGKKRREEDRRNRILARTQHILVPPDPNLDDFDPAADWYRWNNWYEYDEISLEEWKHIPKAAKQEMLTVISDVNVYTPTVGTAVRGAHVDPADPNSFHMLVCEGVGEFKVQGWYDAERRWVPEVDIDGPGPLTDSDFFPIGDPNVPGVLYPYRIAENYGGVNINNLRFPQGSVTEGNFNAIPGLGRALKFTFTLFDSKGVIKQGRTFTHIVHLD